MGEDVVSAGQFGEAGAAESLHDVHADAPYTAFLLDYVSTLFGN